MPRLRRAVDPRQLGLFDLQNSFQVGTPSAPPPLEPRDTRSFDDLFTYLNRLLRGRLDSLVLIDARTRIISVRRLPGESRRYALRLHRCFAAAPDEVLAAVPAWIHSGRWSPRAREALVTLRRHFDSSRGVQPPPRPASLRPQGRTLDLRVVCAEINARFFAAALAVEITWGRGAGACDSRPAGGARRRRRGRRQTLLLGSFDHDRNLVRIHPVLDAPSVPRYVVESLVYHELLHAALPPVERGGRRLVHPPEFRRRERLFPDHARAQRWIDRHLPDLLRRR